MVVAANFKQREGEAVPEKKQWFCDRVEERKTALYRLAYSILQNPADAEDAVAEAVYRAYAGLDRLRQPERFPFWLSRIVVNEAYGLLRKRGRTLPLEEVAQTLADPPAPAEGGLWPLVQALPQTLRAPLVLFYYDGYSVRETAQILGLREGTVKTRLCRGRQLLKERLEKEEFP